MKRQIKNLLPLLLSFVAIILLPVITYISFVSYNPEISEEHNLSNIEGTVFFENIPYPQDAVIISEDKTAEGQTATLETQKTLDEVQEFYENILLSNGWKIEIKDKKEDTFVSEYKKDKKRVVIASSTGHEATIATISLTHI